MFRLLALAAPAAVSVDAAAINAWTKGGDLCAGIVQPCASTADCTAAAIGPCTSAQDGASQYLRSEFVGMAFVENGYLTDFANKAKIVDMDDDGTNGYRDFDDNITTGDGGSYAYTMSGARFGNMSSAGGYAGIASYLNTGGAAIVTSTNEFRVGDHNNKDYRTDQGTGDYGAPMGPYDVCIAELNGGACGAARTFRAGEYKFSIFGYTSGADYPPPMGQDGFPQYTHIGVRMRLTAHGFDVADLLVNGGTALADIGDTDVTKVELAHGSDNKALTIDFPQSYNVGVVGVGGPGTPTATRTVSIKVSDASQGGVLGLFIDYLFAVPTDLDAADRYFAYDPTVSDANATEMETTATTTRAADANATETTTTTSAEDRAMASSATAAAPAIAAVAGGAAALALLA